MSHHPERTNFRRNLVEHLGVITCDDQNEVIRGHLNDVKASESFNVAGLGYDLVFSSSKQIGTWWIAKVKMIHDGCRHMRDPRCSPGLRARWSAAEV